MQITEQRLGAVTVMTPRGPLVAEDLEGFKQRLLEAIDQSLGRAVVDLSAVPFVDSGGLETLLEVTEKLGESGRALKLCALNDTIREVLELTDLAPLFELFEDSNAAVRSFM